MTKVRVKYRRLRVWVECDKPDKCQCCLTRAKKIDLHHWIYAYKTEEVRKNPQLALDNATWLDYPCHQVADALGKVLKDPKRVRVLERLREEALKRGLH